MKWKCEPVALVAAIQTLVGSLLVVLSAFDVWSPTDAQRDAISGAYTAVTGVVLMFVRGMVTPNERVGLTTKDVALIEAAQKGE